METAIIIPARRGSTRFANKPLAHIHGRSVLNRTWRIAKAVEGVDAVFIATDDEGIRAEAQAFGADVVMTPPECENGTMRVMAALERLPVKAKIAINLQGDAVLTPPWVIQAVVDEMAGNPALPLVTPATRLDWDRYDEFARSKSNGRVSGTLVVFDKNYNALYFSKGLIPFVRDRSLPEPPIYRHIGLYGYRYETLVRYAALPPSPLEQVEKLEQLRALENGIPIRVVPVSYQGRTHWSIDNPEDIAVAEAIITREGELLP